MSETRVMYPQDEEQNEYRYIHFAWLDEIAMGLTAGAKKHPGETWREIPSEEHVSRAIRHLSMHLTGDCSEPHLVNASMRCMMAFATATGVRMPMERAAEKAPQVALTAEEMAMLTDETEAHDERKSKPIEEVCAVCGKVFMTASVARKYCSEECREAAKAAYNKRQSKECKQKPKEKAAKTKEELSAKEAEEARRKESAVHLGELTKTAREAGMSYGQYMAKKRMAKGEEA
ncbi:dATP/dGTP diphosphohydrolase domain-containing protein [Selenomonas sp.]|uniref:dATP/dGTP diphosphohydrolase domain-containing protein n=1 Tax=Selenomonas sp. TaxID=2053611 RepID=UPI003FA30520